MTRSPHIRHTNLLDPDHALPAQVTESLATRGHTAPYYADDQVTLYSGDALRILRELPDGSVDAVVADPPYCSGGTTAAQRTGKSTRQKYVSGDAQHVLPDFAGDQRDQRSFTYWCSLWLAECHRITRPGGVCVVFTDWRQLPATTDAIQAAGWTWRGVLPWHKPGARPQKGRFSNACEYAVWASKGPLPSVSASTGECLPGLYSYPAPHHSRRTHITEKPVELLKGLISIVPAGGVVLDPFAGSGSTGAAALATGRRFMGIEISAHYAEQIKRRLHALPRLDGAGER